MKTSKGGAYEREMCRFLSLWWTGGKREDVFWRTACSGARATIRSKVNKKTFGSYGDIAVVDPIGLPLVHAFTVELKRGYPSSTAVDILDSQNSRYLDWFKKAEATSTLAGSRSWLLIHKRDRRDALIFIPFLVFRLLPLKFVERSVITYGAIKQGDVSKVSCCRLDDFVVNVHRKDIEGLLDNDYKDWIKQLSSS